MTVTIHPKAQALLDAQVAFTLKRLHSQEFAVVVQAEIDFFLSHAAALTLAECVTADMIKETVHRYAIELDLGAGVFDIIGDIARTLHGHSIHQYTCLNDIMPDRHFEQLLDKLLELDSLRHHLLHELLINPVYAALASDILFFGLRDYLQQSVGGRSARSVWSWSKQLLTKMPPELEYQIELNLRQYVHKAVSGILSESETVLAHIDTQRLRDSILDIWDSLKTQPISTYQQLLTSLDVEEICVLFYEFWRDFRDSEYFRVLIDAGIDAFFNRYGNTTLDVLLEEVGIKRDMLVDDAIRFAPPILAMLQEKQLLEPIIRRHLASFYASEEVATILTL
ncbi:hypothetical protein [Agitococcus lubricus]|uniref:Uncharacterized protein n=1 Tax=Agitococcus lubricus TaxID=1077255 RepID=A0A2T5IYK0_9GAMM|nr:hypothetical protein [Agitococcus lubricus]PTQ89050.1 hypothetical protein C8N29_10971 [Agitococcus lubricus]